MVTLKYNPKDSSYVFLVGDSKELKKIESHFNKIPQYMFLKSFRGTPCPEVFIHKILQKNQIIYYCYSGLWKNIVDWCASQNIEVTNQLDNSFKYTSFNLTYEEWVGVVSGWELKFQPYEYQLRASWLILKYRQSLSQLATRAGKTLIAYMVFRQMIESGAQNILMIVPSIMLVKQGVEDMKEYKEFFQSDAVWAKGESCSTSNLTIGTFQSLVNKLDPKSKRYDPKFFNKFDVICIDEAHTGKCASIKNILNQPFIKHLKLKFGFSGSLPKAETIESYTTQSFIGPVIQDIRSKELMDGGFITPINITQIQIEHPLTQELKDTIIECGEYLLGTYDEEKTLRDKDSRKFTMKHNKKLTPTVKYIKSQCSQDEYIEYIYDMMKEMGSNSLLLEQMLVHQDKLRIDIMEDLFKGMDKNCIIFAHHTEYLNFLYKYFSEKFPDRKVYCIHGGTNLKKRGEIKTNMLTDSGALLFASYGCMGTGLTLKNIDYGVFAQSFKSDIINKQSLGRGLCLANDKDVYKLYDIIDIYPTKRLYLQGREKLKLYKSENFTYDIIKK